MKLNEIKPILTEGLVPIEIFMMLRNVIKSGKITDNAQTVLMSNLVEMLRYKTPDKIRYMREHPAPKEIFETIRDLDPSYQVSLADWLYQQMSSAELYDTPQHCHSMNTLDWVKYVLRKQD